MDFELPEELRLLKKTVRTFVDRELMPVEMHSMDGPSLRPDIRADLERKAKELGLWLLDVPKEYGGAGLSLLGLVAVWEEVSRSIALPPRGPGVFGPDVKPILFTLNGRRKRSISTRCYAARRPRRSRSRSPTPAPIPAACAPPRCPGAITT
jgi:acyl-CoA dehydrogenase